MKVDVFAHWADLPGSADIARLQMLRMREHGLFDEASSVNFCIIGSMDQFMPLISLIRGYDNVYMHLIDEDVKMREYTTLNFLQQRCMKMTENQAILYTHLKGSSRTTDSSHDWRKFLEFYNIDHWRKCVAKLDEGYDTAGVNYTRAENGSFWEHYSGNFWWATSDYIKRLTPLHNPRVPFNTDHSSLTGFRYTDQTWYFDHEAWIGTGKPKAYEIAFSPGKEHTWFHYHFSYPKELYQNNIP